MPDRSAGQQRRSRARPPAKGLVKATRASLFVERSHRALTREAEELLFEHAEVMTEGSATRARDAEAFFGSTMITIDLDKLRGRLRGLDAPGTHEALRDVVGASVRMRLRAMRIACAEVARRVPERDLGTAQVEIRTSLVGSRLHLDVDLEVPFDVPSERRAP
jgi:hypothetical protein